MLEREGHSGQVPSGNRLHGRRGSRGGGGGGKSLHIRPPAANRGDVCLFVMRFPLRGRGPPHQAGAAAFSTAPRRAGLPSPDAEPGGAAALRPPSPRPGCAATLLPAHWFAGPRVLPAAPCTPPTEPGHVCDTPTSSRAVTRAQGRSAMSRSKLLWF